MRLCLALVVAVATVHCSYEGGPDDLGLAKNVSVETDLGKYEARDGDTPDTVDLDAQSSDDETTPFIPTATGDKGKHLREKADGMVRYTSTHSKAESIAERAAVYAAMETGEYVPNTHREQDKCLVSVQADTEGGGLRAEHVLCDVFDMPEEGTPEHTYRIAVQKQINKDAKRPMGPASQRFGEKGSGISPLFRVLLAFAIRNYPEVPYTQAMNIIAARMLEASFAYAPRRAMPRGTPVLLPGMHAEGRTAAVRNAAEFDKDVIYDEYGTLLALEALMGGKECAQIAAAGEMEGEVYDGNGEMTPLGEALLRVELYQMFTAETTQMNKMTAHMMRAFQADPLGKTLIDSFDDERDVKVFLEAIFAKTLTLFCDKECDLGDRMWRYAALPTTSREDLAMVMVSIVLNHMPVLADLSDVSRARYVTQISGEYPVMTPAVMRLIREDREIYGLREEQVEETAEPQHRTGTTAVNSAINKAVGFMGRIFHRRQQVVGGAEN